MTMDLVLNITPVLNWISGQITLCIISGALLILMAFLTLIPMAFSYREKRSDWVVFAMISIMLWAFGILLALLYYDIITIGVI
ncbi:MAG TPA: hypothetical protein VMW91_02285 [Desulfosporosinus sp.]|nr:hypothetical protein [Desulfosporosinus sp.]